MTAKMFMLLNLHAAGADRVHKSAHDHRGFSQDRRHVALRPMGVSPKGIVWDDSGEKVNFVVLSAIPSAGSAFFLKLMSDLMGAFRRKPSRTALLAAADPAALWKALERATCRVIR